MASQPQADAGRRCAPCRPTCARCFTNLGPLITVVQDRPAGDPRRAQRRHAAARLAGPVPRAAQPDPHLALAAPAADLRLHLQRRRRPGRQDDRARPAAAARATTCASSARSAPRRCPSPPTATPTTAATPTRRRCGWPIREPSRLAATTRAASPSRPGTAPTPAAEKGSLGHPDRCSPRAQQACWVAPPLSQPARAEQPEPLPAGQGRDLLEQVARPPPRRPGRLRPRRELVARRGSVQALAAALRPSRRCSGRCGGGLGLGLSRVPGARDDHVEQRVGQPAITAAAQRAAVAERRQGADPGLDAAASATRRRGRRRSR